MTDELAWVVPVAIALVTAVGGIVARDRYILNLISKNHEASGRKTSEASASMHQRIDRIKDDYVRRVDLDSHIGRLDLSVNSLAAELRSSSATTNQRLDTILAHFVARSKDKTDTP